MLRTQRGSHELAINGLIVTEFNSNNYRYVCGADYVFMYDPVRSVFIVYKDRYRIDAQTKLVLEGMTGISVTPVTEIEFQFTDETDRVIFKLRGVLDEITSSNYHR